MSVKMRILAATAIVVLDSLVFFLPLSAIFLAYIIIIAPKWFFEAVQKDQPE